MRITATFLLVAGLGFLAASLHRGNDAKGEDKEIKRKPRFTIGKETSYVTGPVDKDGFIDYAAALNERLSKGIKPQDNACVLLWKACGPRPQGRTMPPEFFKWLGIEAPPERGDYFIGLEPYLKDVLKIKSTARCREIVDQMGRDTSSPWTPKDYPEIAAWLKANEKPVALVVEATKRPHFFHPLVPPRTKKGSSGLINAPLPLVQSCPQAAQALVSCAMLHAAQGHPDNAWQDLLACHRLGRVVAGGASFVEALTGIAIDINAVLADLAFLSETKLTSKQLKDCLRDLQALPPMPAIADKMDLSERFWFLESVMIVNRDGAYCLEALSGSAPPAVRDPMREHLLDNVDWDPALRNVNRFYDRMVRVMRLKDRGARAKQLDEIGDELKAMKEELGGVAALVRDEKESPKVRGKAIGDILICLAAPAFHKIQQAADRTEQWQANLHIAFALACYQRENGHYPMRLEALAPKYLPKIPKDSFSGKALIYRPSEGGYLLYSVGVNGEDDEGRGYKDDPPGDDLAFACRCQKCHASSAARAGQGRARDRLGKLSQVFGIALRLQPPGRGRRSCIVPGRWSEWGWWGSLRFPFLTQQRATMLLAVLAVLAV